MHDCFTIELTGECLKCFFSTDERRACRHGVIGSTMGAYPGGTGSNPVEGNGHFFPSYRQLYLLSFSGTHTHTHTHTSSALTRFFPRRVRRVEVCLRANCQVGQGANVLERV